MILNIYDDDEALYVMLERIFIFIFIYIYLQHKTENFIIFQQGKFLKAIDSEL